MKINHSSSSKSVNKVASKCERCGDTGYDTQGAFCLCRKGQSLMLKDETPVMAMQITWKDFKFNVEGLGVRDSDLIDSIDVKDMDPRRLEVTQLNESDPGSSLYSITSSETPNERP